MVAPEGDGALSAGRQPQERGIAVSRRAALRLLCGAGILGAAGLASLTTPGRAFADTASDLSDAQAQLDAAQAQLDQIASDYETLSTTHAQTLEQIEQVNGQIAETEQKIEDKQAEIEQEQATLSRSVRSSYKGGNATILDVLLSSSSFEELSSNIHYLGKINEASAELITQIKDAKAELEQEKSDLESQQAQLQQLSDSEQSQLDDMSAKQQEAEDLISSLSSEVQSLMAQRDAELAAQAAAAAAAHKSYSGSRANTSGMSGTQAAVVSACYSTPSPGLGYCAAWVSNVFVNAGVGFIGGDACDMYSAYCTSSDRSALKPGMIIAVSTHPHTAAGRIYGHVGIYVGGGTVMDNVGYIRQISVDSWISFYGATVPARWGWLGGVVLT